MTLLMLNGHQTSTKITIIISEKFVGQAQELGEEVANLEDGGLERKSEDEDYKDFGVEKNESQDSCLKQTGVSV